MSEDVVDKLDQILETLREINSKLGDMPAWWSSSFDLGDSLGEISTKLDRLDDIKSSMDTIESNTASS